MKQTLTTSSANTKNKIRALKTHLTERYDMPAELANQSSFFRRVEHAHLLISQVMEQMDRRMDLLEEEIVRRG